MTSQERWRRVQELYETLEPLQHGERVRQLQAIDPALARDVSLLFEAIANEEAAQESLKSSQPAPVLPKSELPGLLLLEPIGSGGSGVVYRAIRLVEGAEQAVAVKVLHEHRSEDSDVRRFAREREIMAALNHPGVVHFLDAGVTADGRPFLVMELAEGCPITTYCDQRRLRVETRVRLMLDVCQTVAAAHARLIVHLDLKPSNILVTPDGAAKLLDLGTARLLQPQRAFTVTRQLTPQYASPEQLRSEPSSVASDVYSLGLIFFELLSGGWPFAYADSVLSIADRAAGTADVRYLADAGTPESAAARDTTLTRLRSALSGDLALICQKALAFETSQRYQSVVELAEDLRRYLEGEPVLAHPPGFLYRARKFSNRYRGRLLLGFVLVAGLAGAAVYSAIQARTTRLALDQADAAMVALAAALGSADAATKPNLTLLEFLQNTEATAQFYVPQGDAAVRSDFERALAAGFTAQDDLRSARDSADRALRFAREAHDVRREVAALVSSAGVEYRSNRLDESFRQASQAFALWKVRRRDFSRVQTWSVLAAAGTQMLYARSYDAASAEVFSRCLQEAKADDPAAASYRTSCLYGQAMVDMYTKFAYADALPLLKEVVHYWRSQQRPRELGTALQALGLAYRYTEHYAEDEQYQREAAQIQTDLAGPNSLIAANYRAVWAGSLALTGKAEHGLQESLKALTVYRRIYPKRADALLWTPLSAAMMNAYLLGRYQECIDYAREGLDALGPTPDAQDLRRSLANTYLGLSLAKLGRSPEAKPLLKQALAAYRTQERRPYSMSEIEAELARMK